MVDCKRCHGQQSEKRRCKNSDRSFHRDRRNFRLREVEFHAWGIKTGGRFQAEKAGEEKDVRGSKKAPTWKSIEGVEQLEAVYEVDQSPIGKTSRSTPATYVKVFDEIRKMFAQLPDARARGYTASRFSFNTEGGRCEACKGNGQIKLEMNFLPTTYVVCEECNGRRFNSPTLEIEYNGKSIGDIMDLSIEEAADFFSGHPKISRTFGLMKDTGLGYLRLGQPSPSVSGGEAQRIKLVSELTKGVGRAANARLRQNRIPKSNLYLIEEPSIGLHGRSGLRARDRARGRSRRRKSRRCGNSRGSDRSEGKPHRPVFAEAVEGLTSVTRTYIRRIEWSCSFLPVFIPGLMDSTLSPVPGKAVSDAVLDQLARTKGWTRFFSVMLWIGAAFLVLGGIGLMLIGGLGGAMGAAGEEALKSFGGSTGGFAVGAIYLVMAFFYIYPALKLGSYSSRISALLVTPSDANLAAALNEQRAFWKYVGIMMIVMFILYFVVIIGAVLVGGFAAAASSSGIPAP